MKNKDIPAIRPTKYSVAEAKLLADRIEWEKKYDYWLKRANRYALKLQGHGRNTETSPKYAELAAKVKVYHTKLRDTLPEYRTLITRK